MKFAKTTCPFCTFGAELGIAVDESGIPVVEYPKGSALNDGKLCPRGNAAGLYLDSPDRLTVPIYDGKSVSWGEAFDKIVAVLKKKKPNQIALTYDTNLTEEEYSLIHELGAALKTPNIASSYLEPEYYFNYSLPGVKKASLKDIEKAQVFLLIGDVFNRVPLVAKHILDAKYSDRNNRIFVIDCVCSHTASFADTFIQVNPGQEATVLLALSEFVAGKSKGLTFNEKQIGVSRSVLEPAAKSLNDAQTGVLVAVMNLGSVYDPLLLSGAAQYLTSKLAKDKKFLAFGESMSKPGKIEFTELLSQIKAGRIKALLNFGEFFPFYYPQVQPFLEKLDLLAATATLNSNGYLGLLLPAAINLEKSGTITTAFGDKKIKAPLPPMSGTKTAEEIIKTLIRGLKPSATITSIKIRGLKPSATKEIKVSELLERVSSVAGMKPKKFTLVGEKPAYGFKGFYEYESRVKVNPEDAVQLGIEENDLVTLKTPQDSIKLRVIVTSRVPSGCCIVPVELPETRGLFKLKEWNGVCTFPPTEVELKLEKKGRERSAVAVFQAELEARHIRAK